MKFAESAAFKYRLRLQGTGIIGPFKRVFIGWLKFPFSLAHRIIVEILKFALKTQRGRELIFLSYSPNNLLVAIAGNEKYIVNSSDYVIGFDTYRKGRAFDVDKLNESLRLLPNHHKLNTLVDIGANIGTTGIHAIVNKLFERCFSFEPEPNNFKILTANIALNGLQKHIVAHDIALSDGSVSELDFELSETNPGDHRVRLSDNDGLYNEKHRQVIKVTAGKLDDFQSEIGHCTSLLWVDTQGFEGYVLAGAKSFLEKGVPLVTEFWPYGMSRSDCFERFLVAIESGPYSTIIDLKQPNMSLGCNRQTLVNIANTLGYDSKHTDLLIF